MVTIQDVAKAAGVSPMTVSHVINEHPHVRDSTRQKVLGVMAELDYRVNVAARNLRTGRTGTIGLAVPDINRPYSGQLAAAIIAAAEWQGMRVAVEQTGRSRESELDVIALSRNRLYDGLILSTVYLGPADADLLKVDYPVVILGERIFDGPVDHVAMPNVDGAQAATAHLLEQGCRRIAIIDGRADEPGMATLRFEGYRRALEAAGIAVDPSLVVQVSEVSMEAGAEAVRVLLDSAPDVDGVFCITDTVATGALRGLADIGVPVPGRVKVIGFDNVDGSAFTVPSLSSVDPDHTFMAETAVRLLTERIKGGSKGGHRELVAPYRVVVRESSAATPGRAT